MTDHASMLAGLAGIARAAGNAIMAIYADADDAQLASKADNSPLTRADLAADAIILEGLTAHWPDVPVVSEEQAESHGALIGDRFFIVDPLDGTKEFLSRNGEFTVNIALVENGRPVAGVVYAPALDRMFRGSVLLGADQQGAGDKTPRPIRVRDAAASRIAVASRSHRTPETDEFLDRHAISECVSAGSSLKFCLVAAGEADIYPRFGPTMEWDTAAGHAVLASAGGSVVNLDGSPFLYGKAGFRNPFFLAIGDQSQTVHFS